MESIRGEAAEITADAVQDEAQQDFDHEFDAMISSWSAEQGEFDATRDCLDALVETRMVMAAMQAREQRLLAQLESIALTSCEAGRNVDSRDIAWRSMVAEVSVATRLADRTVQSMMCAATAFVETLPGTLEALETGRISIAHARVILEHARGLDDTARSGFESLMIEKAEVTTPGKLASTAKITAARLRADTFEERHARACESRSITIKDLDNGMSELIHLLPTPFAAAIFDRLTCQAKAVSAARNPHSADQRTRDQLRSDITTELLLTGEPALVEDAPHSAAGGIRAEISITIPALTLLGKGNAPATLTGRGPIDLDTALRLASAAPEFIRVLTDPVTDIVISADTYRPSASFRRYLAARDQHCQFPTCNRDTRWCDLDHTVAWEHGGKSIPDNLAHLCRAHHVLKHHSRWKVRQSAPGVLEWTTPHGEVVAADARPGPRFRYDDSPPPF